MRLGVLCFGILAACAAEAQRNRGSETDATERACGVEDCFFERDIRDFEVIDQTHLIIYIGSQRCPFHVEVQGTFCDLTFAPDLYFSRINEMPDGAFTSADPVSGFGARPDPLNTPNRRNLRICSNDLRIQVHGGQFTESSMSQPSVDRFGTYRADCQLASVTAITDDQLVEFYVKRRVIPPLPPMGSGQIEVGEQDDTAESAPDAVEEGDDREQPSGRRGRSR